VATSPWLVSDELWELVEPLLPKKERRSRYPGRKRLSGREALCGILFVLHTGTAWMHLPQELGFGSGYTCWRRLDEWQRAGVWEKLHRVLLSRLRSAGEIEWSRAIADSSQIQAKKGAPKRARARSTGDVRDPARVGADWWEPQRRHPAAAAARPCPRSRRPPRTSPPAARHCDRRPRLRPRQLPSPGLAARHQTRDRPSQHRARLRAWPLPLGRRTHLRLAPPDETTARPLRTPRRHPRSVPRPRLLPDLLPTTHQLILK
jgi:transposase